MKSEHLFVNGIVAQRDKQPYIQLSNEHGMIAQLSMSQARQVAHDILTMASRTEADAMVLKFLKAQDLPEQAGNAFMMMFRDYRAELDAEPAGRPEEPE